MKIKNLNEKILDLDGEPVSIIKIDLDSAIRQLESGISQKQLLEQLKTLKEEKKKDLTYKDLYEEAVFLIDSKEPNVFAEALFIAQSIKDNEDLKIEELNVLKSRIPLTNRSGIVKGRGIVNLDDYAKEERKANEEKKK